MYTSMHMYLIVQAPVPPPLPAVSTKPASAEAAIYVKAAALPAVEEALVKPASAEAAAVVEAAVPPAAAVTRGVREGGRPPGRIRPTSRRPSSNIALPSSNSSTNRPIRPI